MQTIELTHLQPQCNLQFTDAAQERILDLRDNMHKPALLRVYVRGGGCSGFEYQIELAQDQTEDDIVLNINPFIRVLIDPISAPYLEGSTVDYQVRDMDARFVFQNPNAKTTCGCGSSFSVE